MDHILDILKEKGIRCYQTDRFNLDHTLLEPYQDDKQEFQFIKPHETKRTKDIFVNIEDRGYFNLFKYFLDGSRYTYKIAEMETGDNEYMPIIAGQLAAGVCSRTNGNMKKYILKRKNILTLYHLINEEDFNDIKEVMDRLNIINGVSFNLEKYGLGKRNDERPESSAIAKLQSIMHDMEIEILSEMVQTSALKSDEMLMIDGSLQFLNEDANEDLFEYVIGISKSFNPNLSKIFINETTQIGAVLTKLKYRQRTPVYRYPIKNSDKIIGAWYLRIRPEERMKNPLDGIIKVEKMATTTSEKDNGFDTDEINTISQAILLERNVTCYGNDARWCNHLYPIYLTESMLKSSFLSQQHFINLF
ncbi:hypothetical protein [Clostridium sp. DJ247]|uniref:hypothetical protein n=1 Tax=Clostridium sp. DJ247 TaxID=2726188 RepID=UPI0016266713|nr:hypothetical protein [Clostridium sp. DJ247]MBC2579164.1 hypothetical protein [Clostridium sp. DJ247]